jgi:hypothetical protein
MVPTKHLFGLLTLLILLLPQTACAQKLSKKFFGVWTIVKITEDGQDKPMPENPEEGADAGEAELMEIIIQDSRIVLVQNRGSGGVAKVSVLGAIRGPDNRSVQKVSIQGIGWEGMRDGPLEALLDVNGDQLKIAVYETGTEPDQISEEQGDQQFVITANRMESEIKDANDDDDK